MLFAVVGSPRAHYCRVPSRFITLLVVVSPCLWHSGACAPQAPPVMNDNDNDDSDNGNGNDNDNAAAALFTVAAIGDYGDDDDNTRAVADMIKGWNPDLIITVGDNDYSDGAYRGTFDGLELAVGQYFHEYIGNYQGDSGPGASQNRFFPSPGDHDWGDTCDDPEGLDDYLRYFTLPEETSGNERYYDFVRAPAHFFAVHSLEGCEPDGVTQDSVQGQWVEQRAADSASAFRIGYFHNPPWSSGSRHIDEGAHMRWDWDALGFDLILSGDDHVYERIQRDGVTFLIIGLGGVDIHGFVDTPQPGSVVRFAEDYGALRIDVYADRLEVEFLTVGGLTVDEFTIPAAGGGSGDNGLDPDVPPVTEGDWYRPPVSATWQWQLQPDADDQINTSYDADIYDVDLFDVPDETITALHAAGRRVICYFSAGTFEDFREDADEFQAAELGNTLDDFADERWLDIRSSNVHAIMRRRLDYAVERGCDGVEPDNVTGFNNNTGFPLTASDQLAFNRFLANQAHARDLSVALKNDLEQIPDLVDYFDFAVNEQCHEFDECDAMLPFIAAGKPVLSAEYAEDFVNDPAARAAMCAQALANDLRTLVLPVDLDDAFRFSCDE